MDLPPAPVHNPTFRSVPGLGNVPDKLSTQKLRLEITKLRYDTKWAKIKNRIFIPFTMLSIVFALIQMCTAIQQRANEYNKTLATQITSYIAGFDAQSHIARNTSAATLALFGPDAIDPLVSSVGYANTPHPYSQIISALDRLKDHRTGRNLLRTKLLSYLSEALDADPPDPARVGNYVAAIGELFNCSNDRRFLQTLRDALANENNWPDDFNRSTLRTTLRRSIERVERTAKCN